MPEPRSFWRTVRLWWRRKWASIRASGHCLGCAERTRTIPLSYFDDTPTCHWCGAAVEVDFVAGHYVTEHRCEEGMFLSDFNPSEDEKRALEILKNRPCPHADSGVELARQCPPCWEGILRRYEEGAFVGVLEGDDA